jgi:hypothetical protein
MIFLMNENYDGDRAVVYIVRMGRSWGHVSAGPKCLAIAEQSVTRRDLCNGDLEGLYGQPGIPVADGEDLAVMSRRGGPPALRFGGATRSASRSPSGAIYAVETLRVHISLYLITPLSHSVSQVTG